MCSCPVCSARRPSARLVRCSCVVALCVAVLLILCCSVVCGCGLFADRARGRQISGNNTTLLFVRFRVGQCLLCFLFAVWLCVVQRCG